MKGYNTNLASEFHVLSVLHRLGVEACLTLGNLTGPDRSGAAGDLAISNPTPVNVIGIGIKAGLDWIPTSGSGIVLAQNGAGTYYGVGATTTTLGAKTVGKAASSVLAAVAAVKLTADVANYFGSLVACSLDPLKK